jgi:hypothetical protein
LAQALRLWTAIIPSRLRLVFFAERFRKGSNPQQNVLLASVCCVFCGGPWPSQCQRYHG